LIWSRACVLSRPARSFAVLQADEDGSFVELLTMKTQGSYNVEILGVGWKWWQRTGIELRYLKGKPFQMRKCLSKKSIEKAKTLLLNRFPSEIGRSSLFTSGVRNLGANMKCARILSLAITLATTSMFGQSLTQLPRIDPSKCPVGLEVEQNRSLVAYKNAKSGPADDVDQRSSQRFVHQRSSQRFDFKTTNFLPHEIVNAEITAHAFSDKWRVFSVPAPTPDLAKTVDVPFDVKENGSASRELSFANFPVIRTFDVNSVTYADGSTWHAASPGACSVVPNLIMRISAQ
jgi:hypothetical protein